MEVKDTNGIANQRKKGQRRIDLFRRENLETWVLIFPPGDVQRMHSHPSDRTYYVLTGRGIRAVGEYVVHVDDFRQVGSR